MIKIEQNRILKDFSTIKIGGPAKYYCEINNKDELIFACQYAKSNKLKIFILGDGSNTLISDSGIAGLVIKNNILGFETKEQSPSQVIINANSGMNWDKFVSEAISLNLSGVECLSGIPGTVGASPIQNIGAYGQEVSQTILNVTVFDLDSLSFLNFNNHECKFSYRDSLFKSILTNKYFVYSVSFLLNKNCYDEIRYHELLTHLKANHRFKDLKDNVSKLNAIRSSVLALRRKKSMVIDLNDINTRSLGSFFTNPIINKQTLIEIQNKYPEIQFYKSGIDEYKIPAAWLIEKSGFNKGFRYKNVGLSNNHCLAIVNFSSGTCEEVLELSELIKSKVNAKFQIILQQEPVIAS